MARRRRYQQGIWTDGPGVAPTMWSEPEGPRVERAQLPNIRAGVSPNYGGVSSYLDTMQSRFVPEESVLLNVMKGWADERQRQAQRGIGASSPLLAPRPTRSAPPSVQTSQEPSEEAPPTPPTSTTASGRKRKFVDPGFGTPPIAGTSVSGLPTPPPAPSPASKGVMPPPPMAGAQTEDFLVSAIRNLPEEFSRPTGATFVDEPTNPFPAGEYGPTPSNILDPSIKFGSTSSEESLREWLKSPPASRTHGRTPKK